MARRFKTNDYCVGHIETKYLSPTDTRGTRIKVKVAPSTHYKILDDLRSRRKSSKTFGYQYDLNSDSNHIVAAVKFVHGAFGNDFEVKFHSNSMSGKCFQVMLSQETGS